MKLLIMLLLLVQCALIGLSVFAIATGPTPINLAVHVPCIAANLFFGFFNIISLTKA